jgi:hypothetical protein
MKKIHNLFYSASAIVLAGVLITGCTANSDEPTPAPTPSAVVPSEAVSEVPTPTSNPTTEPTVEPTKAPEDPQPTVAPTATAAEPPATQFLKRWGTLYPGIQEASIADAASSACQRARAAGENWVSNADVTNDVKNYMSGTGFGDVSGGTANDFTADALERFCA